MKKSKIKICVAGLGYIGLPTAGLLATKGFKVYGYDVNETIVQNINSCNIESSEPDLDVVIQAAVKSGNLKAHIKPACAQVYVIAVPTPHDENKRCDTHYIEEVANSLIPFMKKGCLVILESTVVPGTTQNILVPILEKSGLKAGIDFYVAYSAERVLPGRILFELVENARIVGGINEESAKRAAEIYRSFVHGQVHITDCQTAEVTKLMENTFRDVNIALANEFAQIAEKLGFDIWEAIRLANLHPRVNILNPGPGVGGHCIAVDPWFLVESDPQQANLIRLSREINDYRPVQVAQACASLVPKNSKIAILGVSYKGNVDDTRESPAILVIQTLMDNGFLVSCYDPLVETFDYELASLDEAIEGASLALVLVDHQEFSQVSFWNNVLSIAKSNLIIYDTRHIIPFENLKTRGIKTVLLGSNK